MHRHMMAGTMTMNARPTAVRGCATLDGGYALYGRVIEPTFQSLKTQPLFFFFALNILFMCPKVCIFLARQGS
jgi:hypothetical protein